MIQYTPPLEHMAFLLGEWLQADRDWAGIAQFSALDLESAASILDEAGRFATRELLPLNSSGDIEGCRLDAGRVRTPAGFAQAYQQFVAGGWPSLSCAEEAGGQGLPQLLNFAVFEMLTSANHAWVMYPGLLHGAYECIRSHGSEQLRALYLPRIVSGEWLATMCLTEPQAGSDLSLVKARAEPVAGARGEPTYHVSGSKIFVSGGSHDLSENIVHLVLARLPDAPPGTGGLSLFLVPQHIPEEGGLVPNEVHCDGLEHKMGIRGSATCLMRFERAIGWLVGEENRGLSAMFLMMNAARLHVGLQGLAHSEVAYQSASGYASGRMQMRAIPATGAPSRETVAIIAHPPIRRAILELQATVQGERAIGYWAGHLLDLAEHHPDEETRLASHRMCSLLTPAIKVGFTSSGFEGASKALQVYGGHGYLRDHGIEQTLRDSRIAMIYEGTNEIQAIDLLVRKVLQDRHDTIGSLFGLLRSEAGLCRALPGATGHADALEAACRQVEECVLAVREATREDAEAPYRAATEFCRAFGLLLLAFAWARTARVAIGSGGEGAFRRQLVEAAAFGRDFILPELDYRQALLLRTCRGIPGIAEYS